MAGFSAGEDRQQAVLFLERLDELVPAVALARARAAGIGRQGYDPGDLLRLYSYGYLNGVRSSRGLEREGWRNLELAWPLCRLRPDFKIPLVPVSARKMAKRFLRRVGPSCSSPWPEGLGRHHQPLRLPRGHVSTSRRMQRERRFRLDVWSVADRCPASGAAFDMPRALVEIRRIRSRSPPRASGRLSPNAGFLDPVSSGHLPMPRASPSSHPRQPRRCPAAQPLGAELDTHRHGPSAAIAAPT